LPKEDAIEVMGEVVEKFKAGMFSIELDAGRTVLATMAGISEHDTTIATSGQARASNSKPFRNVS
jgi:translation initiation factor IF-1